MSKEILDPYNVTMLQSSFSQLGYEFDYTPETGTTMKLAEDHAQQGKEIPAIFLTDHQTQGIGREGRTWQDKRGASILVTGLVRIEEATTPILTDLVSLHICRVLAASTETDIQIKYPNDLVIKDKKTGGILVLNLYDNSRFLGTSVGMGINVHYNQPELAEYPTDYGVTSLDLHTSNPNCRQTLLMAIFAGFKFLPVEAEIFQTNLQNRQEQNNLWRDCSAVLRRQVQVESEGEVLIRGRVVDTQIGRGILVVGPSQTKWLNQFDTIMKVRLIN